MPDCSKQQERLNELNGELEDLQRQLEGASPQQKAGIGRQISVVRKKIEIADADLKQCLNQGVRGAIFPEYYVVALLYSPPGIGSETVYGNGSTAGTTTETSHSFKEGLNVTTSGGFFGNGIDVSVAFAGGSKNGTSFEVKKEKSSSLSLQSLLDEVDHSRDVFFIWTNVQIDVAQQLDSGLILNLRSKDAGNAMEIVSLTVAELRDPSLIPGHKKSKLANFTQQDFSNILA